MRQKYKLVARIWPERYHIFVWLWGNIHWFLDTDVQSELCCGPLPQEPDQSIIADFNVYGLMDDGHGMAHIVHCAPCRFCRYDAWWWTNGTPPPPFLRYSKWSLRDLRDWSKGQNLEAKCFSGEEHTDLVGCHLKRNLWDMYLCREETIDKDIETVGKPLSWLLRLHPVLISCSSPAAP